MARLKNPENRIEAIRQDYRDKHASGGGAVLVCRKYDMQVRNKAKKRVFDKDGNPVTFKNWYEAKFLTKNEEKYVDESFMYSEDKRNDCYSTINSFPPTCEPNMRYTRTGYAVSYRSADKLAYLTGFYLDFDHIGIHNIAKKQQATAELVDKVLGYADSIVATLEDYFPSDYGMPVISYTGGGFGFYIPLKPLEATEENKARYMNIWEKLYQRFNSLFSGILDVFENDHSVLDFVRVIRITGTYNSKTGTFSRYIGRYGDERTNKIYEYSLNEVIDLYHLGEINGDISQEKREVTHSPLQKIKEREKKREEQGSAKSAKEQLNYSCKNNLIYPSKWYQGYANGKQLSKYLELSVKSLEYLDNQGALQRNDALFLIACLKTELEYAKCGEGSFYKYGKISKAARQAVLEFVLALNDSLTTPLEDEELANLIKSALSGIYHFRKKSTIQKFLNLTDEEFANLGWLDKQKAEQQKQERNNALTDQDREVIRLYLSGLSDTKIAEELHISKRTSIRTRQRLGVTDRGIRYESIDFEGNRRHLKKKAGYSTPEMRQFIDTPLFPGSDKTYGDFFDFSSILVESNDIFVKYHIVAESRKKLHGYLESECAFLERKSIIKIVSDYGKKAHDYAYASHFRNPRILLDDDEITPIDPAYSSKLVSFGDSELYNLISLWRIQRTS